MTVYDQLQALMVLITASYEGSLPARLFCLLLVTRTNKEVSRGTLDYGASP